MQPLICKRVFLKELGNYCFTNEGQRADFDCTLGDARQTVVWTFTHRATGETTVLEPNENVELISIGNTRKVIFLNLIQDFQGTVTCTVQVCLKNDQLRSCVLSICGEFFKLDFHV